MKRRAVNHTGQSLVALLLASAAGCSLFDPLGGISDGTIEASTDGGAGTEAEASRSDGAVFPNDCPPEQSEREPNVDPPATVDPDGDAICGYVSATDTDKFTFVVSAGQSYALRGKFEGLAFDSLFTFTSPDKTGFYVVLDSVTPSSAGGTVTITVASQSTTPRRYSLTVSRE